MPTTTTAIVRVEIIQMSTLHHTHTLMVIQSHQPITITKKITAHMPTTPITTTHLIHTHTTTRTNIRTTTTTITNTTVMPLLITITKRPIIITMQLTHTIMQRI